MQFPGLIYRVPVAIAEEQGYFEDAGIKISEVEQPANLQGTQALIATGADVANIATATFMQGYQAGIPVQAFCGGVDELSQSIVALPDSGLPTSSDGEDWQSVLKALDGKSLGVVTPVGSALQLLIASALEEAGATNVNYVNLGAAPTGIQAALENHTVDAAMTAPPGLQVLAANGAIEQLIYLPDGPPQYKDAVGTVYGATAEWLDSNPEAATGFCDAITKALAYIADDNNAEDVARVTETETSLPADVAKEVIPEFEPYSTELDTDRMQTTIDTFVEVGILKPEPEVTTADILWEE